MGPGYPFTFISYHLPLLSRLHWAPLGFSLCQSILGKSLMCPLPVTPIPTLEHLPIPPTVPPMSYPSYCQTQLWYYFLRIAFPLKLWELSGSPTIWLIHIACFYFHNTDFQLFNRVFPIIYPKLWVQKVCLFLAQYPQNLSQCLT